MTTKLKKNSPWTKTAIKKKLKTKAKIVGNL